ncbi:tetratricopeptide repeat protein [Spirochaetia bacterium 38H-sp]|uniref:Tetratricopeptide repeat protein n=1 Tax=Rarispira pelagica TaxID=3141764 RepID=A0ABU9UC36_9SPIR
MQPQEKTPAANGKIISFILKNRWIITAVAVAVIVVFTGVMGYLSVIDTKNKKAAIELENLTEKLGEWISETDQTKKEAIEKILTERLQKIALDYKNTFASQRAYYILGELFYQKENWEKAAEYYKKVASANKNYLSFVSLSNLAVCMENNGKLEDAIKTYKDIIASGLKPLIPRAKFNLARLLETTGKKEDAIKEYSSLSEDYPNSMWTNIAKQRLLLLEISN